MDLVVNSSMFWERSFQNNSVTRVVTVTMLIFVRQVLIGTFRNFQSREGKKSTSVQ